MSRGMNRYSCNKFIFTPVSENFANVAKIAEKYGCFDFCLADLGVSSMQIDNPERGFSFKVDGPLDLRLLTSHMLLR